MNINEIKHPNDIKGLNNEELKVLSADLRNALIGRLEAIGGHNGPNLGMVEMTVALHYVFNSPVDKIVFDISHQSYIHKMLTGRILNFTDNDKLKDISGYTNPNENEHDFFTVGHTSTSISLASGLAKARDLKNDNENIIAVIGDGSLSGGEAFEGFNYVAEQNTNMIMIVNDNDQSIAENHGGLYNNLKELRNSNGESKHNFFKSFGLDYEYLDDGHDINKLIELFTKYKDSKKPVVLHIHTIKGKGIKEFEENREAFHAGGPIDAKNGTYKSIPQLAEDHPHLIAKNEIMRQLDNDSTVSIINAGTPSVLGFTKDIRDKYKKQYVDVGIAEEQEIAMSSGMAKNGAKPIVGIYATFMQRTFDQLSSDLALNNNSASILVYGAGAAMMTDETHLGIFDISMISNIANLTYLAPTSKEELETMIDYSVKNDFNPIAIRIPVGKVTSRELKDKDFNKYEVFKKGKDVAIIAVGNMFEVANEVSKELDNITVINPRNITTLDTNSLDSLLNDHKLVITLEDGILDGGFGQKVASYYSDKNIKVKNFGLSKKFHDRYNVNELYKESGLEKSVLIEYINSNK